MFHDQECITLYFAEFSLERLLNLLYYIKIHNLLHNIVKINRQNRQPKAKKAISAYVGVYQLMDNVGVGVKNIIVNKINIPTNNIVNKIKYANINLLINNILCNFLSSILR